MMKKKQLREQILNLVDQFAEESFVKKEFVPQKTPIPASGKLLGSQEIQNMVDAALDGWLTTGRFNSRFEKKLAKYVGVKHALTVNSGSSANLVAFSALTSPKLGERAIQKGDEVIGVAAAFPTTVNPIVQFGAVPVFVDVDKDTHNIKTDLIEKAITPKTKAIMLAHTLGNPFDLNQVQALCKKYNLWLVEDSCDALGSLYDGKMVGTFGDIATLSFYPAHHITMGEGGAVLTNNDELKVIAESFRDWGRDCYCAPGCDDTCKNRYGHQLGTLPYGYDHKYIYSHLGYNLKISDMQAACGLAQLERLDSFIQKRRENFTYLASKLDSLSEFFSIAKPTPLSDPSWFGFPITLTDQWASKRLELIRFLNENKIGTRLLFAGDLTRQPYFKNIAYRVSGELKNTESIMNNTLWIGVFPGLDQVHLDFVSQKFNEFFLEHQRN